MYLIRNKDGSIKKAFTNEFVQQGSNNVNYYDFAIIGLDSGEWSCDCYFELPNGEYATLAGVPIEFNVDDIAYKGYRVYLSSAILSYAGILKVVSRVYDKNGNILYSYPYEQMINATTLSEEYDAPISEAEYKSFMALLASYITSYNNHLIRKYDTMENALKDIDKIVESEHILISDGVNDYAMYYKAKSTDTTLTLVPNPTNWSEIYSYTGLTNEDLSKLSLTTLKDYVDKYDIKEVNTNLLTGVFTTTLTLKDLSTLVSVVNFNSLYYTKNEVYSKEESDSKYLSQAILNAYLTITQAKETYLSKEDAKEIYENKTDLAKDYYNKTEIDNKNANQDTNINNVLEKANAAYALAEGKGAPHIFDTYKDMKEALLNAEKVSEYHLGDTIYIKEKGTSDYWISAILDEKGEYGYYELQVNETDLSLYQEKEDNSLETENKTIVGAINENKAHIATKQESSDNSLSTENKTIVGAINENKGYIDTLTSSKQDKEDSSLITDDKNIVNAINANYNSIKSHSEKLTSLETSLSTKQEKSDLNLKTESKVVVNAINELLEKETTNESNIKQVESKIPTKTSDITNDSGFITSSVNDLINYTTTTALNNALNLKANKSDIPTDNKQLTNGSNFITKDISDLTNYYDKSSIDTKLNLKLDKTALPTKLSAFTNDTNFITKEVNNLTYYYLKTEIDTLLGNKANTSDIPTKVSELSNDKNYVSNTDYANDNVGGVVKATPVASLSSDYAPAYVINGKLYSKITTQPVVSFTIVDELPTTGTSDTIYLVLSSSGSGQDIYKEYIWIGNKWEQLGTEIDLTDYAKITYVDTQISSVNSKFNNYYTSTILDTKLSEKLDASKFVASEIVSILGTTAVNRATSDKNGNDITSTYGTITAVNAKLDSSKFTATNIVSTLGTSAVNRATGDKNGNDITSTYALKTSLNNYLLTANFTATNIVNKLGTIAVNRATSDASGNVITSTYATITALNNKLDNTSSAIINTLGNNAVNYATKAYQDENGNNIALTYQKTAFIVNGTVSTSGIITFTNLDNSALASAISDKRRIIFVPSDTTLQPIILNSSSDNGTLFGSVSVNNTSSTTIYNCKITITMNSSTYEFNVSGTYTSQLSNYYELPIATSSILGGVKVDNDTINVDNNGVISAKSKSSITASADLTRNMIILKIGE